MTKEFVKGDKVIYYGRKGVVKSYSYSRFGDRVCEVEYSDSNNPHIEEVNSEYLIAIDDGPPQYKSTYKKSWVDSTKYCPVCETKWTVTKFRKQVWYDCCICNKTKEQIMKD